MSLENEQLDQTMDSNEILGPILSQKYELIEEDCNADTVISSLARTIESLPQEGVKVVSLIGGAASGKSTFSRALVDDLAEKGMTADVLATDDYVKGDRNWRWEHFEGKAEVDPRGKYDFELLNNKLDAIKKLDDPAAKVGVPTYDQASGLAVDAGEENYEHRVGKVDVIIVEGDFHPVERPDLTVYLHVPDTQRLQSRVNRDVVSRGGDQAKTTSSFKFRQQTQHFPHTLAAAKTADYLIDTDASQAEWSFCVYRYKT